jgi:hypothetical protein
VAKLWTNTGTLLGSATFAGESASGWQQVAFAAPIAITANTTYVISYHTSSGHYASAPAYFATAGVDTPPLHGLKNGVDGFNGVYLYGPAPSRRRRSTPRRTSSTWFTTRPTGRTRHGRW